MATVLAVYVLSQNSQEVQMKSVLCVILVMVVSLCGSRSSATNNAPSTIKVAVDPRIELLTIVQLLADWELKNTFITDLDFSYRQEVLAHFSQYAGHAAPVMYPDMLPFGFAYITPVQAMMYHSNPPELRALGPIPERTLKYCGGSENLEKFMAAMRDFAITTKFKAFFDAHRAYYDSVAAPVRKIIADHDYAVPLEEYCGVKQHSYTIVLGLLQSGNNGYGPRGPASDGSLDVYFVGGVSKVENGVPFFGTSDNLEYLSEHEFGHSFINPLVIAQSSEILKYSSLFRPVSYMMKKSAYGEWETCVAEHILRAVNARMTYLKNGQEAERRAIQSDRAKGFAYLEALCARLEEYEKQRDKYPTLESFFPELIGVFKQLSEANLGPEFYAIPFFGTVNAVTTDKKTVVLIVPSNESDKAVQDSLCRHVQRIHDRFYPQSPIFTDTAALKMDLSANSIVVYGTAKGNLWLARLMPKLPVRVEPDRIVANGSYYGTDLRFISAWPNPQNHSKGVAIYTAQQTRDIIGINGVFHGPTDYVIARDTLVLQAGPYAKKGAEWTF
jgi:hypothetical protein